MWSCDHFPRQDLCISINMMLRCSNSCYSFWELVNPSKLLCCAKSQWILWGQFMQNFYFYQALTIQIFCVLVSKPALYLHCHFCLIKSNFSKVFSWCKPVQARFRFSWSPPPFPFPHSLPPVPRTNSQLYSHFLPYMCKVALFCVSPMPKKVPSLLEL